jgi:peptide deformylase
LSIRSICFEGDPVLTQVASPVARFDDALATLVRDMFETMYAAPGRGLAAPQVGVPTRVFVVDTKWKEAEPAPMVFVNPRIAAQAEHTLVGQEACLSIPGKSFDVRRPVWVDMEWRDVEGTPQKGRFEAVQAVCICHELDHLDGVLITESGVLV